MSQIKQKAAEAAIKVFRASITNIDQHDFEDLSLSRNQSAADEVESPKTLIDERFLFSEDALTFVAKCFDFFDRNDVNPYIK